MFVKFAAVLVATLGLYFTPGFASYSIPFFLLATIIVFVVEGVRIVPQQNAWVVERLGKYHSTLVPGLNVIVPFFDRVAYRHSLKEVPLDIPEQVCITKDNTQLAVDGIIYFQVMDPKLASYGSSDYITAITQLAQTALRSEVGKMELDKTFESRDEITLWREKRALIAKSEGVRQEEINIADGQRQAAILASEGEKQAAINKAQGEAQALTTVAEATASAVRQVAAALEAPGGQQAANLKIAEKYVEQFGNLAKAGNTLIVPANIADVAGMLSTAMTVLDKTKQVMK